MRDKGLRLGGGDGAGLPANALGGCVCLCGRTRLSGGDGEVLLADAVVVDGPDVAVGQRRARVAPRLRWESVCVCVYARACVLVC